MADLTEPLFDQVSLRHIRTVDVVLAVWVVGWIVVAIVIGIDLHRLGRLSDTLASAGSALSQVGSGLHPLGELPFVGSSFGKLSQQLAVTAASAQANASASKHSVDQLSYLLGITIAIVPMAPVLGFYLPARIGRLREARAVRRALQATGRPDVAERFLAQRALVKLSFRHLLEVSPDPWDDIAAGRFRALADAELRRLGFVRERAPRQR